MSDAPGLTRHHRRRCLREIYRSVGWPCHDMLEMELLAAGQLERVRSADGHETLVEQVALAMGRAGRLAWCGLALHAQVPLALWGECDTAPPEMPPLIASEPRPGAPEPTTAGHAWVMACPDVYSIRRSTVEAYLEPVVHEIKVSRANLLGDLKKPAKRAAYLNMASACWYVLGNDARGRPVGGPADVPPECGVLLVDGGQLVVAREAPRRTIERLPLQVWMTLAQAGPVWREDETPQQGF